MKADDLAARASRLERWSAAFARGQEAVAAKRSARARADREVVGLTARIAVLTSEVGDARLEAAGMVAAPEADPDAVRARATVEADASTTHAERLRCSEAERQAGWAEERPRILRERARVRRQAEESGATLMFATADPPLTAPDWYGRVDGAVTYHAVPAAPSRAADGTLKIDFGQFDAVRGCTAGYDPGPTPEQAFAAAAKGRK